MYVEHDPTGFYRKGQVFTLEYFLNGLRQGLFPIGMKVTKRAETFSFRVSTNYRDYFCLVDDNGNNWGVVANKYNGSGVQMKRDYTYKVYKA